jgi:hypothetical protein
VDWPTVTVTVEGEGAATAIIIATFTELPEEIATQGFDLGEITSADGINLPAELAATGSDGEALTIEGVAWSCDGFDAETAGIYEFSAALRSGYQLAEGVELPTVTVIIRPASPGMAALSLDAPVTTVDTLKAAVAGYENATADMEIAVGSDITITETIALPGNASGKTLTITSAGGNIHTLTRGRG